MDAVQNVCQHVSANADGVYSSVLINIFINVDERTSPILIEHYRIRFSKLDNKKTYVNGHESIKKS